LFMLDASSCTLNNAMNQLQVCPGIECLPTDVIFCCRGLHGTAF
jgi:hypothetical protein